MTSPFSARDRRALSSVAVQFFVNGALFASFVPRLPEIRDKVDISVATLGVLMSVAGLSGLVGSAVVGHAIGRFGTRQVMFVAGILLALSLPIVGIATTPLILLLGLVGMMTFDVLVDVAMNMQGSWLSARRHAPVMNRLHGLWSLGTVVGGLSSSRLAAAGVSLSTHLAGAAALLLAAIVFVNQGLLREDEQHETSSPEVGAVLPRRASPMLVVLGLAGITAVAIESTSIEWAAFRLADDFGVTAGFAALAYVAVTTGMTIGRFGGDSLAARLEEIVLLRLASALTGFGLVAATMIDNRYVSLVGYVAAGLGIATMLPTIYDRAAKHPGRPGAGLGALTAGLRTATLSMPIIVGSLAATSLSVGQAVAIVTLPSVLGFVVVNQLLQQSRSPRPE